MQGNGQMAGLIADDLCAALIPDDHRTAAAQLTLVNTLEITCGQVVIRDRHSKPPDPRIKRRALRHSPRTQDPADLDPQVEMQRRRVMQLDNETRRHHPTLQPAPCNRPLPADKRTNIR